MENVKLLHPERMLTEDETLEVLAITEDKVTGTLFKEWFARKPDGSDPRFHTNDYFKLPTSRFNTSKEVYTTIGIYIVNVFLLAKFFDIFGYVNKPFTAKLVEEIEDKLAEELYRDKIDSSRMADYYNRIQWLGGNRVMSLISPSLTSALLTEPKEIIQRKKELFEKYKDQLGPDNPNNSIIAAKIEKELVEMAKKYISTQDGAENFDSLGKVNVQNHYKNMNIMKGPVRHSYSGKYNVNSSNYNSGISKDEYVSFADSSVMGSYMRAINTGVSGYMAKETNQGLTGVKALPKGSDCKTKRTLRVFLYPKNKSEYLYRNIVVDGILVELNHDNISKYINTWVDMRSPLYCLAEEPCYCNACLGNQPYMMNLENFGLAVSRIPNKLLTISMKSFHDQNIKASTINIDDLFMFEN